MPTCREGRRVKRMAKLVQQGLASNLLKGVQGKNKTTDEKCSENESKEM